MLIRKLRKHKRPLIFFVVLCFLSSILFGVLVSFAQFFI